MGKVLFPLLCSLRLGILLEAGMNEALRHLRGGWEQSSWWEGEGTTMAPAIWKTKLWTPGGNKVDFGILAWACIDLS